MFNGIDHAETASMIVKNATTQISAYEGGQDIRNRAFEFACRVALLCQKLYERGGVARLFVSQLLACSSSTATMLEEGLRLLNS